jgi:pimeloyl-ACP methyl ester carboxylesterase
MTIKNNIVLQGIHKKPILTDLIYQANGKPKPIVIFAHGYKGYKDWGCWNMAAAEFAKNNFFFVKFNFSHNGGTAQQPIDFPDLEAFGNNNFIKELDDLQTVIDWLVDDQTYKAEMDRSDITLIGHSRGGGIVTIKASEDHRIKRVITWAGVSDYGARFPKGDLLEQWKKDGVAYIANSRTKQQMPLYYQFYKNFKNNKDRLYIERAVKKLSIPHLIVHGKDDTTVPIQEAENLHLWNGKSKLCIIEHGNHTFGSVHPWQENKLPEPLAQVVNTSIEFCID